MSLFGISTFFVAAAVGAVLAPAIAAPLLSLVGFSVIGPVAGSWAAGVQSIIGTVSAGSLFAGAQSVAMGGAVPAIIVVISAAVTGAASILWSLMF